MAKSVLENLVDAFGGETTVDGIVETKNDIRVDGQINGGVITTGRLVIGEHAVVEGDVTCLSVDILGRVRGNICASGQVVLKNSAVVQGDISASSVAIHAGALFNGRCEMKNQ